MTMTLPGSVGPAHQVFRRPWRHSPRPQPAPGSDTPGYPPRASCSIGRSLAWRLPDVRGSSPTRSPARTRSARSCGPRWTTCAPGTPVRRPDRLLQEGEQIPGRLRRGRSLDLPAGDLRADQLLQGPRYWSCSSCASTPVSSLISSAASSSSRSVTGVEGARAPGLRTPSGQSSVCRTGTADRHHRGTAAGPARGHGW